MAEVAQKARDNVIDEINLTVQQTKVTVDSIAKQLHKTTLQKVATELVGFRTNNNMKFEKTSEFKKGTADMWEKFTTWLTSLDQTMVSPSLSLTINGSHRYDSGLLLAYLLSNEATRDSLKIVVKTRSKWRDFAAEKIYIKTFSPQTAHLHWILFYDDTTQLPVAYANAQMFTQELMVYHRLKQHDNIDELLNNRGPDTIAKLQKAFPSIQTVIFDTKSPSELVKLMIDQQLAVAVTSSDNKPYVVKLARMIQLAAEKD